MGVLASSKGRGLLVVVVVVVVALGSPAIGLDPTPNRPDFKLPFPCNVEIDLWTYDEHDPVDKKVDMAPPGRPIGIPILASAAGEVHQEFPPSGIEIRHGDGWFTTYMHMGTHVPVGTKVEQGDVIGTLGDVGSPGNVHLHYEQLYNPGQEDADVPNMVNPVLQGEGPIVMETARPLSRTSTNCRDSKSSTLFQGASLDDEPYGAIGDKWHALGGVDSVVGGPVQPEMASLNGGRFQDFENGMIIWHPNEAWEVHGRILSHYRSLGSEGRWGFPTMDERAAAVAPTGSQGVYQYMEQGLFLWSPATDVHVIHGAILDAFVANGSEAALGYPTNDEFPEATGFAQTFETATIHWTPEQGAWVTR